MTRNVTISLAVVGAFALLLAALLFTNRPDEPSAAPGGAASAESLAPAGAPRLGGDPGAPVKLVEFLDYQCPGCAQLQPLMSQVVAQYGDQVDFVARDFPLEMHANAEAAAVAARAAHLQDRFVPMYERLFQTQANWAESPEPEPVFRGYAQDLGLDLAAYDAAVADPATLQQVQADQAAGEAAGVGGTPSVFVDGEQIEVSSVQDITDALDEAVAR